MDKEQSGDDKNRFPIIFRKSRKAFLVEYLCGFFLLLMLLYAYSLEMVSNRIIIYPVLGLSLICLILAEVSCWRHIYEISSEKVTITEGIMMKNQKHVYFHPLGFVPDINVKQNLFQRLFNYGTVYIKSSEENSLEIADVSDPQGLMEVLEELIEKARKSHNKSKS